MWLDRVTHNAITNHGLRQSWPAAVEEQLQSIKAPQTSDKHRDLTALPFVTIDGHDSKDFDDAVYCQPIELGWKLYVAVADVSFYLPPNSPLDKEARARGNSVYLPDRVLPMLPAKLSNDLCSLSANTYKLCVICEADITSKGTIQNYRFYRAGICCQATLVYEDVDEYIADKLLKRQKKAAKTQPSYDYSGKHQVALMKNASTIMGNLYGVYQALKKARQRGGSLTIDMAGSKAELTANGKGITIRMLAATEARKIIEECMLCANVCAGKFLASKELSTLYRCHEKPDIDSLKVLRNFLANWQLKLHGKNTPTCADFNQVLQELEGVDNANVLMLQIISSLRKACYQPENIGHYGLGFTHYAQFTSPIRRYPDLIVHRGILHLLEGGAEQTYPYTNESLTKLGQHLTSTEINSDKAERYIQQRLKCKYLQRSEGKKFSATISNATHFGLFVTLDELLVDGLVPISKLGKEWYHFDPNQRTLTGERSGQTYQIGQRVSVQLKKVDVRNGKLKLSIV